MNDKLENPVRTCANCACMIEMSAINSPLQKQNFCRKDPAKFAQVRVQKPRLNREGKIIEGRDGKPIMEDAVQDIFLYVPTQPQLVCFDGWRPEGTMPGEKSADGLTKFTDELMQRFKRDAENDLMSAYPTPRDAQDILNRSGGSDENLLPSEEG